MMYKLKVIFAYFLFCSTLFSLPLQIKQQIKKDIEKLINDFDPNIHIGIKVVLLNGECLYQKNSKHLFIPASSLKIFTGIASLCLLGVDYRFNTDVFIHGKVQNHILKGDVYLKGSGDPSFSSKDLENIVSQIKKYNINHIEGNIIIDNTVFDDIKFGPGWMWDDGPMKFNAPINALTINHNCINVKLNKDKNNNLIGNIEPKTKYASVIIDAKIEENKENIQAKVTFINNQDQINLSGKVSSESLPRYFEFAITDPSLYAAYLFKETLEKNNVICDCKISKGEVPVKAKLLFTHQSLPLIELVKVMIKETDNLYAECLFKKLGTLITKQGNWMSGKKCLLNFLKSKIDISEKDLFIVDGSGLSRYNLISPEQMTKVLLWISKQKIWDDFVKCLPISGADGTLKRRMINTMAANKVKAKTGSLNRISSLSGYLTTQDNKTLAFCIISNNFIKPQKDIRKLEDSICNYLSQFSRNI